MTRSYCDNPCNRLQATTNAPWLYIDFGILIIRQSFYALLRMIGNTIGYLLVQFGGPFDDVFNRLALVSLKETCRMANLNFENPKWSCIGCNIFIDIDKCVTKLDLFKYSRRKFERLCFWLQKETMEVTDANLQTLAGYLQNTLNPDAAQRKSGMWIKAVNSVITIIW